MEGWQLRRRQASWRGIPLMLRGSVRSGGKRIDLHEFFGREKPWAEELGRKPRRFTARGWVIGPDHDLAAVRLEEAFEAPGAGELVLPHRAPVALSVEDWRIEEPDTEVRLQTFEVDFVEAGVAALAARRDTAAQVRTIAETALDAVKERFGAVWDLAAFTQAQVDAVIQVADAAAGEVRSVFQTLETGGGLLSTASEVSQSIDELGLRLSGVIVDGAVAAAVFQQGVNDLVGLATKPADLFRELGGVASFGADLAAGTDSAAPSRVATANAATRLVDLVRQTGGLARARAASRIRFESSTGAAEVRDALAEELQGLAIAASAAGSLDVSREIGRVRIAVVRDLDARAAKLPARVVFRTPRTIPALVISHQLYGTPDRAAEVTGRNRSATRHPGQIPSGSPLEVLSVV